MDIKKYLRAFRDGSMSADLVYMARDLSLVASERGQINRSYVQKTLRERESKLKKLREKYQGRNLERTLFKLGEIWEDFWMGNPPPNSC
ncbi:MAG: hypothetical protein ABIH59_02200 [archaeon]